MYGCLVSHRKTCCLKEDPVVCQELLFKHIEFSSADVSGFASEPQSARL